MVFTLQHLIYNTINEGALHCFFLALQDAHDTLPRGLLLGALRPLAMYGQTSATLQSLYTDFRVHSEVTVNGSPI
jgi:hypothetical protein